MPNKVLLINPPAFLDRSLDFEIGFPVQLAYIAGIVRRSGWDIEILDMMLEEKEGFDSFEELKSRLKDKRIKLVGISDHTMRTFVTTRAVSDLVKSERPDARVLAGGVNATFMWRELLDSCPSIDYIFRGYANKALNLILESIQCGREPKVTGLVSRAVYSNDETNCVETVTSEDFSPPDLRLLPVDRYLAWTRTYPMLTQTGCNFSCNFCTSRMPGEIQKKEYFRPIDDIIVEMSNALDSGFDQFFMSANTFTSNEQFCRELCKTIINAGLPDKALWVCMTRVELINAQLLSIMKRAGCNNISYGIESPGTNQWHNLNKGSFNIKSVMRAFALTKEAGIDTTAYLMVGAPDQRNDHIEEMIELLRGIDPDYRVVSFFQPFPGTPYWNDLTKYGLSEIEPFEKWNFHETPTCRTRNLSKSEIIESAARVYLEVGQYTRSDIIDGKFERDSFLESSQDMFSDAIKDVIYCLDEHRPISDILSVITQRHGYRGRIVALYFLSHYLRNGNIKLMPHSQASYRNMANGNHWVDGTFSTTKGEYVSI